MGKMREVVSQKKIHTPMLSLPSLAPEKDTTLVKKMKVSFLYSSNILIHNCKATHTN